MADSAAKPRGRKVGDLDDEAAEMGGSATGAQRQPGRPLKLRWLEFLPAKKEQSALGFRGRSPASRTVSFAFAHFSWPHGFGTGSSPEGVPPSGAVRRCGAVGSESKFRGLPPFRKGQVPGAADAEIRR